MSLLAVIESPGHANDKPRTLTHLLVQKLRVSVGWGIEGGSGAMIGVGALFCSNCGESVGDGAFCTSCGVARPQEASEMSCATCGVRQGPGTTFCTNCGTKVDTLPGLASEPPVALPSARFGRVRWAVIGLSAVVAVVVALFGAVWLFGGSSGEQEALRPSEVTTGAQTESDPVSPPAEDPVSLAEDAVSAVVYRKHPGGGISAVTKLPDGRIASGGRDGIVQIWDPAGPGTTIATYTGHTYVQAVVALADGRIVSGGGNGLAIWDPFDVAQ